MAGQSAGYGLMELQCVGPNLDTVEQESQIQRLRRATGSLPADLPDALIEIAMELSGTCDFDRCFQIGIDTLVSGLTP